MRVAGRARYVRESTRRVQRGVRARTRERGESEKLKSLFSEASFKADEASKGGKTDFTRETTRRLPKVGNNVAWHRRNGFDGPTEDTHIQS
jgi:hypothetical protein